METFAYHAVLLLDIVWAFIYVYTVRYFFKKKKFCGGGVFYEALTFLLALFPWALFLFACLSCRSVSVFKSALIFHGLLFIVFASVIIISFFIERKGQFFNVLKIAVTDIGKRKVLFFSVFSFLCGVSIICALLILDFPSQMPKCQSLFLTLKLWGD
ncbi:MAG: hypothetical protein FWC38_04065 [Proteobacteria bacterium]|nr:hypothetical protein [Pseudomonadota bacterium]MCL2307401.1 hypothetical protein [Pseudomonadota bacterium]